MISALFNSTSLLESVFLNRNPISGTFEVTRAARWPTRTIFDGRFYIFRLFNELVSFFYLVHLPPQVKKLSTRFGLLHRLRDAFYRKKLELVKTPPQHGSQQRQISGRGST